MRRAAQNLLTWSKYKPIVVNTKGLGLGGPVAKIPVLIRLNASNAADVFSGASAGGADIRIANAAGTQILPYEIEQWDAAGQQATIWVLADTVKANDSANAFRIYWSRPVPIADGSNGPGVFDTANGYVGAWHFGNGSGNLRPPSATAAPYAYVNNGVASVPGVIGRADTLSHLAGTGPKTRPTGSGST